MIAVFLVRRADFQELDRLPQQFLATVTEHLFSYPIEQVDPARRVDLYDSIGSGLKKSQTGEYTHSGI